MATSSPPSPLNDKIPTGVPGLDEILHGGLPRDRLYLVEGFPGTGKTTLALQFLLEGARRGEKTLYVTLSETKDELEQVAASHGWSLEGVSLFELAAEEERLQEQEQYTIFPASEVELSETTKKIFQQIQTLRPVRIAFDSLSEMRLLAGDALRYRRQILALKQFFAKQKGTVLLLDDQTAEANDLQLQSICHGVVVLEERATDHSGTRCRLRIVKLRGSAFEKGYHDFVLERGGITSFPRLVAAQAQTRENGTRQGKNCRSGLPPLDALLGGGLQYGSSALILGPAGAGKSTIASQFIWSAIQAGHKAACYLFEESREVFLQRTNGIGQRLEEQMGKGLLTIDQLDPTRLSPGEFASLVKGRVEKDEISIIVIDSLNGYLNALPSDKHLLLQIHELLMYLSRHDVLTVLIMAQHGMLGSTMSQPLDVSYMADTVLLLRYFEATGRVLKAISVVKKRMGGHEDTIREFRVTSHGIEIGEPLDEFQGVLGGIPRFVGAPSKLIAGPKAND